MGAEEEVTPGRKFEEGGGFDGGWEEVGGGGSGDGEVVGGEGVDAEAVFALFGNGVSGEGHTQKGRKGGTSRKGKKKGDGEKVM